MQEIPLLAVSETQLAVKSGRHHYSVSADLQHAAPDISRQQGLHNANS